MGRVLLINDSKFEGIIIKDILNSLGHDVKISDEYNAVNHVKSYAPDFFIANYIMKDIRGDQLIALVKLNSPNIKCILTSSNDINEKQFEHKHIDAVIHTPIDRAGMERVFIKISGSDNSGVQVEKAEPNQEVLKAGVKKETYTVPDTKKESNEKGIEHEFDIIRFCPFCGHKLTEKDGEPVKFCAFCGHKL